MRGDYNDIQTTWEVDEDVDMENVKPEEDFYATLWSLQGYFANPPSLDGPAVKTNDGSVTPFQAFKKKTEFILPKLYEQTTKEKALQPEGTKKRKRDEVNDEGFFHPRYLTGKRLLEHEVS
jgi:THO complex subunit 1